MPESSRPLELVRLLALISCALLLSACGPGEARFEVLEVERAEWRGESILVSGVWARGVATPPLCRLREGRDGPTSDDFGRDARVALDGNTFSKEFVREPAGSTGPEPPSGYYVGCSVSLDSGRTARDTAEVGGSP